MTTLLALRATDLEDDSGRPGEDSAETAPVPPKPSDRRAPVRKIGGGGIGSRKRILGMGSRLIVGGWLATMSPSAMGGGGVW